jgi:2-C-methyl-D-erythritol 2,4-cyclodiphosphate synthase
MDEQRIGIGYDLHRLQTGETLALGGLRLPCGLSALAHSDGDVLLHALVDAILGAQALGDIGEWFPDSDPAHAGRDSRDFLRLVLASEPLTGWRVGNCDANLITERPRLAPHRAALRASVADLLGIPVDRVSIKARSNEGCDSIGRGEAIAAQVVVLMRKD